MTKGSRGIHFLSCLAFLVVLQALCRKTNGAPTSATTNMKISSTFQNRNRETTKVENNNITNNSSDEVSVSSNTKSHLKWTSRSAWHAVAPLHTPTRITDVSGGSDGGGVSYVIIHHTATSADACRRSTNACAGIVRAIQRTHQVERGWDDIGYNFLIGGSDEYAEIYEGRGFNVVGAHAVGYNAKSVGIALIGDWTVSLPPRPVLNKLQQLIMYGVKMGHIQRNYILLGHRQVKATACPGNRLYNELKVWPHYEQQLTTTPTMA